MMPHSDKRQSIPPAAFGRVAVLMGGASSEREISLMSGNAVLDALRRCGIDAHPFDPAERGICELGREGCARAFIALHGRGGEDGSIQGALETMGVPYTGSGVLASALCLDKRRAKLVWQASGIPTPGFVVLQSDEDLSRAVRELGLPLVIKPAREGSTIGITKVTSPAGLPAAYKTARRYDESVFAESFVAGTELTAAILGDRPLPLVRIEAPQGNYDYQNKYFSDETRYHCPAGLAAAVEEEIRETAVRAFEALGCRGWGRADVMLAADGRSQFLEMNTVPGMTGHSLVPMAAREAGLDFEDLVVEILAYTLADTLTDSLAAGGASC